VTVLLKATVVVSDDERYVTGQTYDLVLTTAPDPASLIQATVAATPSTPVEEPAEPETS
jgi:hypothetical protein